MKLFLLVGLLEYIIFQKFLKHNPFINAKKIISINGTPEIIGNFGIGKKVLNLTIDNMNIENLKKFYFNIGYNTVLSNESIDDVIFELIHLRDHYTPQDNFISKAIISKNDVIIKTKNQINYFTKKNIEIKMITGGHYPFDTLLSWKDIIS